MVGIIRNTVVIALLALTSCGVITGANFMLFSRNDFVVKRVAESKHQKIAVVYGSAHSYGIIYFLKKHHGFKIDRKFKAE